MDRERSKCSIICDTNYSCSSRWSATRSVRWTHDGRTMRKRSVVFMVLLMFNFWVRCRQDDLEIIFRTRTGVLRLSRFCEFISRCEFLAEWNGHRFATSNTCLCLILFWRVKTDSDFTVIDFRSRILRKNAMRARHKTNICCNSWNVCVRPWLRRKMRRSRWR